MAEVDALGLGEFRWVRPLQSILCLFDGEVVPFTIGGVKPANATRGHRFMAPEPFAVRDFADYVAKLREAKVMLDGAERRAMIARRRGGAGGGAGARGRATTRRCSTSSRAWSSGRCRSWPPSTRRS